MTLLLSLVGWAFLPNLVTGWVQTLYYRITIRAGDPKPVPGSPTFAAHHRIIRILVISLYLLYNVYEAEHDLRVAPTFYTDLNLPFDALEKDVKSRFRRLAAINHPDKVTGDSADSNNKFIQLQIAADTLQNSARRFAYERLGPEVVNYQNCITIKDYVVKGVVSGVLPYYGIAAASVYVLGLLGYVNFGKYYRWLVLSALCIFEVHIITRPAFPPVVDAINWVTTSFTSRSPYLPYEVIGLARKLTVTFYVAMSQLGPLLAAHLDIKTPQADQENATEERLQQLEALANQVDVDAFRIMEMEMAPLKGDAAVIPKLQGKMKEWLVQNTIRADPMVKDALGSALQKRSVDSPAAAPTNRGSKRGGGK